MSTIEKIRAEIERRKSTVSQYIKDNHGSRFSLYCGGREDAYVSILSFLDTLEEHSYSTQKYTPSPSVSIEDVARVQFASHAKVIEKKRKAIFDWEQFKEVAGIFYGFGKKDSSDTLEEPDRSEPYTGKYDEAYLNEKIKKASEHWKGVDVDKYMDEVRGREPDKGLEVTDFSKPIDPGIAQCVADHWFEMTDGEHVCEELEDAANLMYPPGINDNLRDAFIAGAKWQKEQSIKKGYLPPEMVQDLLDMQAKHIEEDMKEQMIKEAVEGNVVNYGCITFPLSAEINRMGLVKGDKVKLIIVKEEQV